jgi:CelD/BcsL family acetyltransferase involved in cellulose biosynthesis
VTASVRLTFAPARDLAAIAADWRALEEAADPSFFQSWTWVGCLAEARFPDPWLLRAERAGRLVGLALLNRRGGQFWLNESGDPALDATYVEHNGVLLARGAADLLPSCLARLLAAGRRLHLSGVDAAHLAAARQAGAVWVRCASIAPFVDLATLPGDYLASLSANTRQQLRRSDRSFGTIGVRRAATVDEAASFLDALAALHQATWTARGRPGAFANPEFRRFHRALLACAVPRGEAELLRITGDVGVIGYLYNFRLRGRVLAYQAGFDYRAAPKHGKPGLTCHHAAIARARAEGAVSYDFLAGADRYKTSLANAAAPLYWLAAAPSRSLAGMALRLRAWASTRRKTSS